MAEHDSARLARAAASRPATGTWRGLLRTSASSSFPRKSHVAAAASPRPVRERPRGERTTSRPSARNATSNSSSSRAAAAARRGASSALWSVRRSVTSTRAFLSRAGWSGAWPACALTNRCSRRRAFDPRPGDRRGRGGDPSPRDIHVAAAAATRLRGISASRPRPRRDPSPRTIHFAPGRRRVPAPRPRPRRSDARTRVGRPRVPVLRADRPAGSPRHHRRGAAFIL